MRLAVCGLACWIVAWSAAGQNVLSPAPPSSVRLGLSSDVWTGFNPNDANAAIRAWAQTILKQQGTLVGVENQIFRDVDQLASAVREGKIDGASILSETFLALDPKLRPGYVFLVTKQSTPFEQYVALVHRASGLANAHDLRGRKILLHHGPRMSLAPQWLETILASPLEGLPEGATKGVVRMESASRSVLGVFFRQSDACVVTTNAFALACELNPQLRRDLRVVAMSPAIVPTVFMFCPGYTGEVRDKLESAIVTLHTTPAGQQVLAVFQCDRMERYPVACLESTRQMLTEYHQLKRNNGTGAPRLPLAQILNDEKR